MFLKISSIFKTSAKKKQPTTVKKLSEIKNKKLKKLKPIIKASSKSKLVKKNIKSKSTILKKSKIKIKPLKKITKKIIINKIKKIKSSKILSKKEQVIIKTKKEPKLIEQKISKKEIEMDFSKPYEPQAIEKSIYDFWETNGYFSVSSNPKKPYVIAMPPPNVTSQLHLGHALTVAIEDILIRYKRMCGFDALWVPGTDHAGIATQNIVNKKLEEEGIDRQELGREKFVEKCWEHTNVFRARILNQIRHLGASCDWKREKFTLDEDLNNAVMEAFISLYEKDLIYHGKYLVNWCTHCHTVLSDIEIEHHETEGKLYYIRYFVKAADRSIVVATTRPETMLGDTAVAVHPDDKRYQQFIGKNLILPIINREVPIIADSRIDPSFGTGAVKITPAHDPIDNIIGKTHNLPSIVIIDKNGLITKAGRPYRGLTVEAARNNIIKHLDDIGNLEKITSHVHKVGVCHRCKTIVQPLESWQWFVKTKPLAEKVLKMVQKGEIKFVPERFNKVFIKWLQEMRDWCISRQLWWGHQIPVWYCTAKKMTKDGEIACRNRVVSKKRPVQCPKCKSETLMQDPDVLDTWFSSGLWPFSIFGWPKKTEDLKNFFPTAVLETGYDIIFFWVARMAMLSAHFLKKAPFHTVFLHGIVRDEQGRKMSKSLGNGIDPLEMIEKYGTDALRLSMILNCAPGTDIKFSESKLEGNRNFINKIWNASRFVLDFTKKERNIIETVVPRTPVDKFIVSRLQILISEVNDNLENHQLSEAGLKLYDFFWKEFCDWYLELAKSKNAVSPKVMLYILQNLLKLLHPFTPFITELIWKNFRVKKPLIISKWPKVNKALINKSIENDVQIMMDVINAIRSIRAEMKVEPARKIKAIIQVGNQISILKKQAEQIKHLARLKNLQLSKGGKNIENAVSKFLEGGINIYLPLKDMIDLVEEKKRLQKELGEAKNYLDNLNIKLDNQDFIKNAPEDIVSTERKKAEEVEIKIKEIKKRLEDLGN